MLSDLVIGYIVNVRGDLTGRRCVVMGWDGEARIIITS